MADKLTLRMESDLADKVIDGARSGCLNIPVGPITNLVPVRYQGFISRGVLKSLLVADEESGQKLREMVGPADIPVIVQEQSTSVYSHILKNLTELGKKAVEEINPWVINVLVDWSGFDHFICHSPLTDDDPCRDDKEEDDDVDDVPCSSGLSASVSTNDQLQESVQSLDVDESFRWTTNSTKFLISKYKEYEHKFKSSVKKMIVWKQIAADMKEQGYVLQSWHIVEKKWRNLKQHYKSIVDSNKKSGNNRKTWEYYDNMNEILATDPAVVPPKTISSLKNKEPAADCSEAVATPIKKQKKMKEAPSWFQSYIEDQRDNERERLDEIKRMHMEQMAILKEKNDLLKALTDKITSHK